MLESYSENFVLIRQKLVNIAMTNYDPIIISWIQEIDECNQQLQSNQYDHPLLIQSLEFITEKLINPFIQQLVTIESSKDKTKLLNKNKVHYNYVIKRISLMKEFLQIIVNTPRDDIFCLPQDDKIWVELKKNIIQIDLDHAEVLIKAFAHFNDVISIGCAYARLGDEYPNPVFGPIIQNLGGAAYLLNFERARQIKIEEITNPSLQFVTNLWSIQDKSAFFKVFMKLSLSNINTHKKFYVPYLTKPMFTFDKLQQEINQKELYKINQFKGLHFIDDDVLFKRLNYPLLSKDHRQHKLKARVLSSNKDIMREDVDLKYIIQQIQILSPTHHIINHLPVFQNNSQITKVVIQIHGGGWVAMSSFSHQSYTRKWANYMGDDTIIFSIDYRLCPKYQYPSQLEDCWQLYLWVLYFSQYYLNINPKQIVLAGDSAGGNMALGICFRCIKESIQLPTALLLAYPAVNLDFSKFNPYLLNGLIDEIAPSTVLQLVLGCYVQSNMDPKHDPYISPLFADPIFLSKLPKITILCGSQDSLTGDTIKFLHRMLSLKKQIKMLIYNGLSHGFMNFEVPLLAEFSSTKEIQRKKPTSKSMQIKKIKREHMGLLEKHQDYKQRATNFQRKRDQLQKLQLKAALKNKDEFNFRMVKGKLKDDRHVDRDEDGEDKDKIMYEVRTQNQNLLKAAISRKEKLCEKLQEDLCLIRDEKPTHTFFVTHSNQISKIEKDPDYEIEKTPTIHRKIEKLKQESKEKERLKGFLVAVTKAKQKFKGKNHQKKKIKKNPMRGLRERQ